MNKKILTASILLIVVAVLIGIFFFLREGKLPAPITPTAPESTSTTPVSPSSQSDDTGVPPEGVKSIVNANNQFAFDLYPKFKEESENGNIFFSPHSISVALAMTYEGARGKTAEEMQRVLHIPEDENLRRENFASIYNQLNKTDAKYKLNTANALWVQQDFKLLDDYTNTIETYYDGKATNVDFAGATEQARQTINGWVEDKTNNKIKNLFPQGSLTPLFRLVLTNAIYFKGTWVKQFDKNDTRNENFRVSSDKTVKVPMMRIIDKDAKFNYAETKNLQILEMPYEGEDLSMLVLLPKNDDITSLEESLTVKNLNDWKSQLKEQRVNVFMPKFTFDTKYFLKENLKEMGMPLAFSEAADFSGINGTKSLFIQIVVHQAFVDVNEEGTEAAAATGIGFGMTSVPRIAVFRVDHPFIFIIQQKDTGNILFLGKVIDPTK